MNRTTKYDLEKRLKAYSRISNAVQQHAGFALTAGAVLGLTSQAVAGVKVVDVNPDVVLNIWGAQYPIDFDGGGANDIKIARLPTSAGSVGCYAAYGAGPAMFMASYVKTGTATFSYTLYPFALNGSQAVVTTEVGSWTYGGILSVQTGSGTAGLWGNKSNKYLGVVFIIVDQIHYGWVQLSVSPGTVTIHQYAYEQTPETGIPNIDASLSVDFTQLVAVENGGNVTLSWVTECETDNLGFIIERKTADADWVEIASYLNDDALKGAGNTSSKTEYAFTDDDVLPGQTYSYRLSDMDTQGKVDVKDVISITLSDAPLATELLPATPNPFNPATKIQYKLAEDADVTLNVVDMLGRTVQTIVKGGNQAAGSYSIHWNGRNEAGQDAASGVYLLVLKAGDVRKTQKVMLVR